MGTNVRTQMFAHRPRRYTGGSMTRKFFCMKVLTQAGKRRVCVEYPYRVEKSNGRAPPTLHRRAPRIGARRREYPMKYTATTADHTAAPVTLDTSAIFAAALDSARKAGNANALQAASAAVRDALTAAAIAAGIASAPDAVRVYPATLDENGKPYAPGMIRAAVKVARRVMLNAVMNGGTDTQRAALQGLDAVNATATACDATGATWEASAAAILAKMATVSHDAQDAYAAAMAGIMDGYTIAHGKRAGEVYRGANVPGSNPAEHIRAAFLSANVFMHAQRAATVRELSTEYVREQGGDVVAIGAALARIIKGDERWTASDVPTAARVNVEALRAHLPRALALCSPVQRDIAVRLAKGYTVDAIAIETDRNRRTVQRNIAIMRGKCAEYLRENAPEVLPMLTAAGFDAFAEAKEAAANMPRTEEGREREAARKKAGNAAAAERMRKLRAARKAAAEKAAAEREEQAAERVEKIRAARKAEKAGREARREAEAANARAEAARIASAYGVQFTAAPNGKK